MIYQEPSKEKKYYKISTMYYSVTDAKNNDVNPFNDIPTFLDSRVKNLAWGVNKKKSKEQFCKQFIEILSLYHIQLSEQMVLKALEKGDAKNKEVVNSWVNAAVFLPY